MTPNEFPRGSEWRKWDLHIHTPASFYWKGTKKLREMSPKEKATEMKKFVKTVNDSDVAVFCLMDYWTFDWYFELQKYIKENPDELKKTIFPGMELRIECPVDYRLNIHCILSNKLSQQELLDFKSELCIRSIDKKLSDDSLKRFALSLDKSKAEKHGFNDPTILNDEKLLQLGSQTAEITKDSLSKAFCQIPNESGFIILPYDTSDGLLKLKWEDHPHDDNYFMQSADIFETRDRQNIDLISGVKTRENEQFFDNFFKTLGGKPKPCISGSDAHKYSDYGKYPSERTTWIKADPTFEGLKQIIYEPIQRVRIQSSNPDYDFDNPVFESLEIKAVTKILNLENSKLAFAPNSIPLNRNLVSIIGGRGKGKSMLINFLSNALNKEVSSKLKDKLNLNDQFIVNWKQTNDSPSKEFSLDSKQDLPFTFIYQSKIKEIADDQQKLKEEVLEILRGAGYKKPAERYDEITVKEKFQSYWNIKDWLNKKDENGNLINSISSAEKTIESIERNINLATDRESKDLLETYIGNLTQIETTNTSTAELNNLKNDLTEFQNSANARLEKFEITKLDFETQFEEIEKLIQSNTQEVENLTKENTSIKEENFNKRGKLQGIQRRFDTIAEQP